MQTGCICDSLTINGIEEIQLTNDMRLEVIKTLFHYLIDKPEKLNNILQELMPILGEYQDMGQCECCGDFVEKYTLEMADIN